MWKERGEDTVIIGSLKLDSPCRPIRQETSPPEMVREVQPGCQRSGLCKVCKVLGMMNNESARHSGKQWHPCKHGLETGSPRRQWDVVANLPAGSFCKASELHPECSASWTRMRSILSSEGVTRTRASSKLHGQAVLLERGPICEILGSVSDTLRKRGGSGRGSYGKLSREWISKANVEMALEKKTYLERHPARPWGHHIR